MITLLDVNVLVALAWPNHIHHEAALKWFERNQPEGWATCPVTQSGFVRVSSNRQIIPEAKSPGESILLLRRMTEVGSHFFWSDDTSLLDSDFISAQRIIGHRQVTDAHLVALTLRQQGRLATFDKGVAQVVPPTVKPEDVLIFLAP